MAKRLNILIVLLVLVCKPSPILADNRGIDRAQWQNITKDYDYTEDFKELKQKNKELDKNKNKLDFNTISTIFIYLLIAIVAAGLAYIIYGIVKNSFSNKQNKKISKNSLLDFKEIEDNLPDIDLKPRLDEALDKGLFKLALRIRYLMIIQKLIVLGSIAWKKNKTNGDFLDEMRDTDRFPDFFGLTLVYERVWYGDLDLDSQGYSLLSGNFSQFADLLGK